jgi:hypothetical protein
VLGENTGQPRGVVGPAAVADVAGFAFRVAEQVAEAVLAVEGVQGVPQRAG